MIYGRNQHVRFGKPIYSADQMLAIPSHNWGKAGDAPTTRLRKILLSHLNGCIGHEPLLQPLGIQRLYRQSLSHHGNQHFWIGRVQAVGIESLS